MSEERVIKSICRMDHGGCGVLIHVKDGAVVRVEGNPEHPISKGKLCVKGRSAIDHLYHPDRLSYPLKRKGERGEGKWERISWDEALDAVANAMSSVKDRYGAEAVALGAGTGRSNPFSLIYRLANVIGTPNVFHPSHVCYVPKLRAVEVTCPGSFEKGGWFERLFYPFDVIPKCLIEWGSRASIASVDSPHPCYVGFTAALPKIEKVIVVDPRYTWEASKAYLWLQIRPGTDGALALGMLNVIVNEGLYDKEFVEKWTFGFEKLVERVKDWPPEKAAEITWIPADKIREAARTYACSKPSIIHPGVAAEQHVNTTQTLRALIIMMGITGNLDVPGGNVLSQKTIHRALERLEAWERLPQEQARKRLGGDRFKLITSGHWPTVPPPLIYESIITGRPYPIRAIYLCATNPMVATENTKMVYEALKRLDFLAVAELYMTPTAELADIVLPAASWLEKDELQEVQAEWGILARQKVIEPLGERWSDLKILLELVRRLGDTDSFADARAVIDHILAPSGVTFEELQQKGFVSFLPMRYKKYEEQGFSTPSGKFEIYSQALEQMGYDPLPHYKEPPESPVSTPELAKEYPLILTTGGRIPCFFHSEFRQIKKLRRQCPDPVVEIHPKTAQRYGIREGDWVWIESKRGRIKQKAKLTTGIDPRVVHAQHGWWFPEDKRPEPSLHGVWESNVNVLTSGEEKDEAMGSSPLRGLLCKIYKAKD